MEESRAATPAQPSRPPSSLEVVMEAITSMHSSMQSHARDTQDAIASVRSDVREEISAVHSNVREVLTEVVTRLERLEESPVPRSVVGLNPGPRSPASIMADVPHQSTIRLAESSGARPKDFTHLGTLRRSERLAHKDPISYRELGSRDGWQSFHRLDLNPRVPSSYPRSISQDHDHDPQQHAASLPYDDPELATPEMTVGAGVTYRHV